jgi:hypothetical protein
MGSSKTNVKVYKRAAKDAIQRMNFMEKKRFVVKVQLPLSGAGRNVTDSFSDIEVYFVCLLIDQICRYTFYHENKNKCTKRR